MSRILIGITSALIALLLGCPSESDGAENEPKVDFVKQIKPLLKAKCSICHSETTREGGFRVDSGKELMRGGDSGVVVLPGEPTRSPLVHAIKQTGEVKMPPPDEGKPLAADQIELIERWIAEGATIPEDESLAVHWSLQKLQRPELPVFDPSQKTIPEGWERNPIDRLIAADLHNRKLQPLGRAEKEVLLRRLYVDLIGLPPTRTELETFLNDASPDAYERVVDRLLQSPQYGERWGRHWMDVWRYSDWDGFGAEVRESKPHIWRWRDWIVESLNQDKPYDEMIVEMLAADELEPTNPKKLRATGFLVRNWYVFNRNVWLDNTIEHTGKAFLGLTVNCARCHDHMYDPMPMREYYQLRAFFEPLDIRTDRIPGEKDISKDGIVRIYDANVAAQTHLFIRGDEKNPVTDQPIPPAIPSMFATEEYVPTPIQLPPQAYYQGLANHVVQETIAEAESELEGARKATRSANEDVKYLTQMIAKEEMSASTTPEKLTLLDEAFSAPTKDRWTPLSGIWEFKNGVLVQSEVQNAMLQNRADLNLPQDFSGELTFRVTGGSVYKSVGISFDVVDDNNFSFLYASAGSNKVQVAHRMNGADQYPAEGAKQVNVAANEEQTLRFSIVGNKVTFSLNSEPSFEYQIPGTRPAQGGLRIWTFDATAEFIRIRIDDGAASSIENMRSALVEKNRGLELAKKKEAIAEANLVSIQKRVEADRAGYANPPAENAKELALAAGRAERVHRMLQEELKLKQAQERVAQLTPKDSAQPTAEQPKSKELIEAENALTATAKAYEESKKSVDEPFENYTRITQLFPATTSGRRLALARWITSETNPLTARVAINHIWLRHFYQPIVPTVFDFGVNGKEPSNRALLDWLAAELIEQDWRMKPIHKLIVMSEAYQMRSIPTAMEIPIAEANRQIDPDNRQTWRQNSRRMEAEAVRDATIHLAGNLDFTVGGPDLDPNLGMTTLRRSLYFRNSKEKKVTFLATFDSPNPVECYRRDESISPQQSLALANSPLSFAQSRILAKKLTDEVGAGSVGSDQAFVRLAFLTLLSRKPNDAELESSEKFLESQSKKLSDVSGLKPFSGGENSVKPSADPRQRARENLIHVLFNHHEFVSVR